jgi:hypothetical protein
LGESPRSGAILSHYEFDGVVVFEGEIWRELDLAAMQKAKIVNAGAIEGQWISTVGTGGNLYLDR